MKLISDQTVSLTGFRTDPNTSYHLTFGNNLISESNNKSKEIISCPSLFSKHNDIAVLVNDQKLMFSEVLRDLVTTRNIPVFENTVWIPKTNASKYQPENIKSKYNLFSGFALDQDTETSVDFKKTKVYDLIQRLVDYNTECLSFLLNFLALKLYFL